MRIQIQCVDCVKEVRRTVSLAATKVFNVIFKSSITDYLILNKLQVVFNIRSRMVNEILKEEMNEIHALTQKCVTPEQWAKLVAEKPELATGGINDSKCINKH